MLARIVTERLRATRKSILLLGPRQVGKSTLTQALQPDLTLNLADQELYIAFAKDPGRLRREVRALGQHRRRIVLDEVQRLPALLNTVQALLDEGPPHQFILTGSSARRLKQRGVNLLPGRIVLRHLDALLFWEQGSSFDLMRALSVGSLPGIYLDRESGDEVLSTYAAVYLREEIQQEAATRDIGGFARFLDVAANCSGQWVNYAKMASDAEIPKETLRRYFGILEDTLLVFRIPAFKAAASRHVSHRDRFVFFDLGVRNAVLGSHLHTPSATALGGLFEQWVILQCIGYIRANQLPWKWCSYRTDAGAEVDFIVDLGPRYLAIEIKWATTVRPAALSGLRSFRNTADKPVTSFVVCRAPRAQIFDSGETVLHYETFLRDTLPGLAHSG